MTEPRGGLSTHVLDTALGVPGRNIKLRLYRISGEGQRELLCQQVTNNDGRTDMPLLTSTTTSSAESGTELANTELETLEVADFQQGTYELAFEVADYFAHAHPDAPQPPFLDEVTLRFTIASDSHYHVPLLLSPWSYSTYRGS